MESILGEAISAVMDFIRDKRKAKKERKAKEKEQDEAQEA